MKLQEKDCSNKNIYFFGNFPFQFQVSIIQSSQGNNFVQFHILNMLLMYKETLEAILLIRFGLLGEYLLASFIYPEKKLQIMQEGCEVCPKNLQKNFRVGNLFSERNIPCNFQSQKKPSYVQKKSIYVNTKTTYFCGIILSNC